MNQRWLGAIPRGISSGRGAEDGASGAGLGVGRERWRGARGGGERLGGGCVGRSGSR